MFLSHSILPPFHSRSRIPKRQVLRNNLFTIFITQTSHTTLHSLRFTLPVFPVRSPFLGYFHIRLDSRVCLCHLLHRVPSPVTRLVAHGYPSPHRSSWVTQGFLLCVHCRLSSSLCLLYRRTKRPRFTPSFLTFFFHFPRTTTLPY